MKRNISFLAHGTRTKLCLMHSLWLYGYSKNMQSIYTEGGAFHFASKASSASARTFAAATCMRRRVG